MSPQEWRRGRKFSQENVASLLGIAGKNPARTWQRWEAGERKPPLSVMLKIEALTDGQVSIASWMQVRQAYLARQAVPA